MAFAASTSLANGKWIVAGGVTGNNSIWGGRECGIFLRKAAQDISRYVKDSFKPF